MWVGNIQSFEEIKLNKKAEENKFACFLLELGHLSSPGLRHQSSWYVNLQTLGLRPVASLVLRPLDSEGIIVPAFLVSQLSDGISQDFSASIIM